MNREYRTIKVEFHMEHTPAGNYINRTNQGSFSIGGYTIARYTIAQVEGQAPVVRSCKDGKLYATPSHLQAELVVEWKRRILQAATQLQDEADNYREPGIEDDYEDMRKHF